IDHEEEVQKEPGSYARKQAQAEGAGNDERHRAAQGAVSRHAAPRTLAHAKNGHLHHVASIGEKTIRETSAERKEGSPDPQRSQARRVGSDRLGTRHGLLAFAFYVHGRRLPRAACFRGVRLLSCSDPRNRATSLPPQKGPLMATDKPIRVAIIGL